MCFDYNLGCLLQGTSKRVPRDSHWWRYGRIPPVTSSLSPRPNINHKPTYEQRSKCRYSEDVDKHSKVQKLRRARRFTFFKFEPGGFAHFSDFAATEPLPPLF